MSENKFNVGDTVKYNNTIFNFKYTVVVSKPDSTGDIVILDKDGEYWCEKPIFLELMPKHTKEELLAYEIYCYIFNKIISIDNANYCSIYQSILKLVKSGRIK